jgi:hypothetical protein
LTCLIDSSLNFLPCFYVQWITERFLSKILREKGSLILWLTLLVAKLVDSLKCRAPYKPLTAPCSHCQDFCLFSDSNTRFVFAFWWRHRVFCSVLFSSQTYIHQSQRQQELPPLVSALFSDTSHPCTLSNFCSGDIKPASVSQQHRGLLFISPSGRVPA